MKFKDYLKERIPLIFVYCAVVTLITLILMVFRVYHTGIIMIVFLLVVLGSFMFFYKFYQKKSFYDKLYNILNNIDNKTLIHEAMGEVYFTEGKILLMY